MEEEKKVEVNTLEQKKKFKELVDKWREDVTILFTRNNSIPRWKNYNAVSRCRSVKRAIRRGRVDLYSGIMYPNRPFNNRKPTAGRETNEYKKVVYGQFKRAI